MFRRLEKSTNIQKVVFSPRILKESFVTLTLIHFSHQKNFLSIARKKQFYRKTPHFHCTAIHQYIWKNSFFFWNVKHHLEKLFFSLIFRNKEKALQQYNSIYFLSIHFPCHEIYINKHKREEEKLSFSSNEFPYGCWIMKVDVKNSIIIKDW